MKAGAIAGSCVLYAVLFFLFVAYAGDGFIWLLRTVLGGLNSIGR